MSNQDDPNASQLSDIHGVLGAANTATQPFDTGQWVSGESGQQLATPEAADRECTNELIQKHNMGHEAARDANEDLEGEAVADAAAAAAASGSAPKTGGRKNPAHSKQHLLAGKDFFLAEAHKEEFHGDDGLVLQGCVVECLQTIEGTGLTGEKNRHFQSLSHLQCCSSGVPATKHSVTFLTRPLRSGRKNPLTSKKKEWQLRKGSSRQQQQNLPKVEQGPTLCRPRRQPI